MEDSLSKKQTYLRENILEKRYEIMKQKKKKIQTKLIIIVPMWYLVSKNIVKKTMKKKI